MKKLTLLFVLFFTANSYGITIAHITDTHFGRYDKWDVSSENCLQAVKGNADIIIITGDYIYKAGPNDVNKIAIAENAIEKLTVPCLIVRGNQDLHFPRQDCHHHHKPFEGTQWVYDFNDYRFIGIDTDNIDFVWLKEQFQTEKIIILCGHYPLNYIKKKRDLMGLIADYGVEFYLSGHIHNFTYKKTGNTNFITGGAAFRGQYGLLDINDNSWSYQKMTTKELAKGKI